MKKFQVNFYKDSFQMLTERNANFVNKIKTLTSRVFDELAKKTDKSGKTSAISILNHLKNLVAKKEQATWQTTITLDDYKNISLPMFPNTGKPIPFIFKFKITSHDFIDHTSFNGQGHCGNTILRGRKMISEIYIEMRIRLPKEPLSSSDIKSFINEFQRILTHEIAHAQDEFFIDEYNNYSERGRTSDDTLRYVSYWLKPTEIRSHFLEMAQILSSRRYSNPNRTFKNMYKTADKARDIGIEHTEEQKSMSKTAYSKMKKKHDSLTTDELSSDALMTVINNAFNSSTKKSLLKNFIFTYHISFVRDYSKVMKERYYDKYFPNTQVPSLEKMNEFFEAIKSVTRTFTKLDNEVSNEWRRGNHPQLSEMYKEFNHEVLNWWGNPKFEPAFKTYDVKLLKKIAKKLNEEFREKYNLPTKVMLTKRAREWSKNL